MEERILNKMRADSCHYRSGILARTPFAFLMAELNPFFSLFHESLSMEVFYEDPSIHERNVGRSINPQLCHLDRRCLSIVEDPLLPATVKGLSKDFMDNIIQ